MHETFTKVLLWIARTKVLGIIIGLIFQYASGMLPVTVRAENTWAICFDHPVQSSKLHLVAVPKRRIATIVELANPEQDTFLEAVLQSIQDAIVSKEGKFLVISNYGDRQEVNQVHLHVLGASNLAKRPEQDMPLLWKHRFDNLETSWYSAGTKGEMEVVFGRGQASEKLTGTQSRAALRMALQVLFREEHKALSSMRGFSLIIELTKETPTASLDWPQKLRISAQL